MSEKPNIVFFFTDDQRFDTISALGHPVVKTPNIDRLVNQGATFTHAHIPSGTVGAICMPSRAMLHTGRTLFHILGAGETIAPDQVMLGETLQHAGYRTFGTGKWHNGPASYARSFTDGGEIMFGGMADHWNVPMCHFDASGRYDCEHPVIYAPRLENEVNCQHVDHVNFGRHSSDILADFTADFIRTYDGEAPIFSYISFLAPHDPRTMPEKYLRMYDPKNIELPESFAGEHIFDYGQSQIRDEVLAPYPRPEGEVRRHIAEYYAMITHLDDAVGRIIRAAEESGTYDNTIFVFAGDNGLAVGHHGLMGKQSHYEHSIRVPLIFAGPGIPKGIRCESYAYLLDIYPTLCDLIGIDTPETVEGRSLVPAFTDPPTSIRSDLFFAYGDLIRSAKDDRHKLVLYSYSENNYVQLFDVVEDPLELVSLVPGTEQQGGSAHTSIMTRLHELILHYRDEWGDRDSSWGRAFWDRFEANGGINGAVGKMTAL